ncbi:hypothetical protein BGZ76_000629 [Entomortierella beljakovae]|nr:hypothetical protein BGZ76_000629 [Entomortierella beljakovae]
MPAIPFDKQEYWSQRFDNEQSFEWLMPWSVLEPYMRENNLLLPKNSSDKILNLGCGNSNLPLDLYFAGYHHVTSVDFVASVVDRMREKCEQAIGWKRDTLQQQQQPQSVGNSQQCPLQFLEMDCLDMSLLPENTFQLCIDKSTSDAISCGDDDNYTKLRTLCEQVARVIKTPCGIWCVISYSKFRQYEWTEGLAKGLWRTEKVIEIKVEQLQPETKSAGTIVHVPDVFQYLYINRRL